MTERKEIVLIPISGNDKNWSKVLLVRFLWGSFLPSDPPCAAIFDLEGVGNGFQFT